MTDPVTRTSSHLSASYSHDTANRLREDEDACYDYDANGNLETKTARVGITTCTGGVTAYQWDVLNRLVRIDNPDGSYSAYRYDAQGRRIEKDVNGALTKYVYDGDAILLEFDGANVVQARYSHGEEIDQPLAMTRGGQSYFYGVDHLGSVRVLTDAAGAVANRYDYDAFGNLEPTSYETVANPFGFTARERDAESGLMFYRARYYDPGTGRFISEDPIGFEAGDLNQYRYVYNIPAMFADPEGTVPWMKVFIVNSVAALTMRWAERKMMRYMFTSSAARRCFETASDIVTVGQIAVGLFAAPLGLVTSAVIAVALALEYNLMLANSCERAYEPPEPMSDDPNANRA